MAYTPMAGDLLACWGADFTGRSISLVTSSAIAPSGFRFGPSHVGMVATRVAGGIAGPVLVESTTLSAHACLRAGKPVSGLQVQEIEPRICDYTNAGGRVDVLRLSRFDALGDGAEKRLGGIVRRLLDDPAAYDYSGAAVSGPRLLPRLAAVMKRTDVDALFCSELCAFVLMRLGLICRRNPALYSPARLCRQVICDGLYVPHYRFTKGLECSLPA